MSNLPLPDKKIKRTPIPTKKFSEEEFADGQKDGFDGSLKTDGPNDKFNNHLRCKYCRQLKHRPEHPESCGKHCFERKPTDAEIKEELEEDKRIAVETRGRKKTKTGYIIEDIDDFVVEDESDTDSDEESDAAAYTDSDEESDAAAYTDSDEESDAAAYTDSDEESDAAYTDSDEESDEAYTDSDEESDEEEEFDEEANEEEEGIGCNKCYSCVTGGAGPCVLVEEEEFEMEEEEEDEIILAKITQIALKRLVLRNEKKLRNL